MDNPMKVLVVEPMKAPYEREISGSLASMQEVVGGDISATYPFDDPMWIKAPSSGTSLLPAIRRMFPMGPSSQIAAARRMTPTSGVGC